MRIACLRLANELHDVTFKCFYCSVAAAGQQRAPVAADVIAQRPRHFVVFGWGRHRSVHRGESCAKDQESCVKARRTCSRESIPASPARVLPLTHAHGRGKLAACTGFKSG